MNLEKGHGDKKSNEVNLIKVYYMRIRKYCNEMKLLYTINIS
jgi:hypothetical protein